MYLKNDLLACIFRACDRPLEVDRPQVACNPLFFYQARTLTFMQKLPILLQNFINSLIDRTHKPRCFPKEAVAASYLYIWENPKNYAKTQKIRSFPTRPVAASYLYIY